MSISNRKDEHVKFALKQNNKENDFDSIKLEHFSLPDYNYNDINLETNYINFKSSYPIYINAMTGGSKNTALINEKLASYAKHFNIPIIVGSQSAALKDEKLAYTYEIVRKINKDGFVVANVSANATLNEAKRAVEMIDANALSIHLNVIQELVMVEGDRKFTHWKDNIRNIVENINVPVIVKEVGFGMSKKTIKTLIGLGVKYIDVSGRGGTNFAEIERKRNNDSDTTFDELGISTVESLKNAQGLDATIFASGGIRNALDIYKALELGASAVGLSGFFLKLTNLSDEDAIKEIEKLLINLQKLFVIFNKKSLDEGETWKIQ